MPALFVHQVNDLLALQQAHQEPIENGDGEQEARAALEDAQKTYVKEVEIGMRVEDKHGLTHKPKDMIEVAMLQGKQVDAVYLLGGIGGAFAHSRCTFGLLQGTSILGIRTWVWKYRVIGKPWRPGDDIILPIPVFGIVATTPGKTKKRPNPNHSKGSAAWFTIVHIGMVGSALTLLLPFQPAPVFGTLSTVVAIYW